jgi:hypothetical protein
MRGTFKGVNWRSMTPCAQIKAEIVERRLKAFGTELHQEYPNSEALVVFLNSPTTKRERRNFYLSKSNYFNNKRF